MSRPGPKAAFAVLSCLVFLSGCSATATTKRPNPARSPATSPSAKEPSPSSIPTAEPLIVVSPNSQVAYPVYDVLNTDGSQEWSINSASLAKQEGGTASEQTAGPNMLIWINPGGSYVGAPPLSTAWVFGATGAVVGTGMGPAGNDSPNPSGTAWAWSDAAPCESAGSCSGAVWEAGVGVAPHIVWNWQLPAMERVQVVGWSSKGVVVADQPTGICGRADSFSTGLLDTATGTVAQIIGPGWDVLDVQGDIATALNLSNSAPTLLVKMLGSGGFSRTYVAPQGWAFIDASVSPDGSHVAGTLFNKALGCGGPTAAYETMLVSNKTGLSTTLPGVGCEGWVGDTQMISSEPIVGSPSPISLVNLSGQGSVIVTGYFIGVLS